jgi:hypothetical protein
MDTFRYHIRQKMGGPASSPEAVLYGTAEKPPGDAMKRLDSNVLALSKAVSDLQVAVDHVAAEVEKLRASQGIKDYEPPSD